MDDNEREKEQLKQRKVRKEGRAGRTAALLARRRDERNKEQ